MADQDKFDLISPVSHRLCEVQIFLWQKEDGSVLGISQYWEIDARKRYFLTSWDSKDPLHSFADENINEEIGCLDDGAHGETVTVGQSNGLMVLN